MALSVDWATKVVTIPQADLTWVSGTFYTLDTNWLKNQLRALEASIYGIVNLVIVDHSTQYSVAGVTYARKVEIISGYSITFEDGQYSVQLTGSNNNVWDIGAGILNQNQVQVIPTNSAGLIVAGSGVTEQDKTDIVDGVWDEVLTGVSHNNPTSAGRRLRDLSTAVITTGTAVSATANTIVLNGDASTADGAYDPALIAITNGTGVGQTRMVLEYEGSTKTAVVDRNWKVTPDNTSEYSIVANPGREHINEGLAQGGTINTITLNTLASSSDGAYVGQVVSIRSGTGEDQACRVIAYNGTTKVATMANDWSTIPDSTSGYVMLPTSVLDTVSLTSNITSGVWDEAEALIVRKILENKVTKVGDVITIYEDDDTTVWRQYDLASGGRVEV